MCEGPLWTIEKVEGRHISLLKSIEWKAFPTVSCVSFEKPPIDLDVDEPTRAFASEPQKTGKPWLRKDDIMDDILNQHDTKIIEPDYSKMTVSELKKILTDKNLTVSGNKTKLIERIIF